MSEIYKRSPTRVDLAGGTLDCWPLYLFLENPVTVNMAVSIYTHAYLTPRNDAKITLISDDLKIQRDYDDLQNALSDTEGIFELHRAHLAYWQPKLGFSLRTKSESPIGGGLGGSSSLCITLLKAFTTWLQKPFEPYEMVRLAANLEAQILKKPTGTQDYFPPIFGGLCFIEYLASGPKVEANPIPKDVFDGRFLLIYTGRAHHSGINNWDVIKNYLDGDRRPQVALEKLAKISKDLKVAIQKRNWSAFPSLFEQEFLARTELSDGFSSPEIRKLKALAAEHGAVAKICGAGGGGCVMIWCENKQSLAVKTACEAEGFQVLHAVPSELE